MKNKKARRLLSLALALLMALMLLPVTASAGIYDGIIEIEAGVYNAQTRVIKWTVIINQNRAFVSVGTVTVVIPESQEYVSGSFMPINDAGYVSSALEVNNISGNTIEVSVNQLSYNTACFTFETTVENPAHYAGNITAGDNITYTNTASFRGIVEGLPNATGTAQASCQVTSKVMEMTSGIFSYSLKRVTWEIAVNQNKLPMQNAVVTVTLPLYQSFVFPITVSNSGQTIDRSAYNETVSPNNLSMTIELYDSAKNTELTISFDTLVDVNQSDLFWTDTVPLACDIELATGYGNTVSIDSEFNIANPILAKSGSFANNEISYTVDINPCGVNLGPDTTAVALKDQLPAGLRLKLGSVELHKANITGSNVDGGPNFTKAAAVNGDFWSYDFDTNIVTVKLPDSNAYVLEYKCYAASDTAAAATYTNMVSFTGVYAEITATAGEDVDVPAGSSAYAHYLDNTTGIKVIKVDADSNEPLEGATFKIHNAEGNMVATKTTDTAGELIFEGLNRNTSYYLTETAAPQGYIKRTDEISVTTNDSDIIKEETITNEKSGDSTGGSPGGSFVGSEDLYPPLSPGSSFAGGNSYTHGSGVNLTHITQKDFLYFDGVNIDGNTLTRGMQYSAESGSTVVTVFADYLYTLSVGKHKLNIAFNDGVTVTAGFTVEAAPVAESTSEPWVNPFGDVTENEWYYGDVEYVYTNGLMTGTSVNPMLFSPQLPTTRGMVVTILYHREGSPDVSAQRSSGTYFQDVDKDAWYANAVAWAVENGIANGCSDLIFEPESSITRQDLALILWRYAKYAGLGVSADVDVSAFGDESKVARYAVPAVRWAYGAGIIGVMPDNLIDPLGTASRAEVAAMLRRLLSATQGK